MVLLGLAKVRKCLRERSLVMIIIRLHRSTTYAYAAYCYRRSSVVCRSVCLSVCRSVCRTSEPCKTAAPIEMPIGLGTRVGPRNHVSDGGPDPPMGRGNFEGRKGRPIVKYLSLIHI